MLLLSRCRQTMLKYIEKVFHFDHCFSTGASEPRNMAYMTRLGLWGPGTPFTEFTDFIQAVEKRYVTMLIVNERKQ